MTYESAIDKIHSLLTFGSRPGLDRMRKLLKLLGNPQDKLQYIHVAGTNGKGSVCAVLSSVLVEAGYHTGLFISPYITDFRERIQINNQMVDKEILTDAVERTFPIIEKLQNEGTVITEFEYVNALAFYIFANAGCDIVILETGLGGLLDCTNVILPPLCAVITTIGLDHTAILGDTIEQIAKQKCGILKKGSLAVCSKQVPRAMKVIEEAAQRCEIPLIGSESVTIENPILRLSGSEFEANGLPLSLPLAGAHQIENAATALAALLTLRQRNLLNISDEAIQRGVCKAVNPARLELLCENPIVLLDGAHNPNGIESLKNAVREFLPDKKITCVMGMLADKDIDSSIALLSGMFERVFTVPVNNPRAMSAEKLAEKFHAVCPSVTAFNHAEQAIDAALAQAQTENGAILICGSLYLAGEIRPYVQAAVKK